MAVSLKEALEGIQSDRKPDRIKGLTDLKHVLKYNRNAPELRKLKDKTFHSLFEDLFRVITKEKAAYSKAIKSNLKSIPDSRLVACADALRYCIESLVQRFRAKTLKAIVGHILQTLPSSDGTYCEPLCVPYLKALATILGFYPHVEHLTRDDWLEAVDFCLEGVSSASNDYQIQPVSNSSAGSIRSRERSNAGGLSFTQNSQGRSHRSPDWKARTEAFLESLTCLVTATNCPILERAKPILSTVIAFVSAATSTTGIAHCFNICNAALSHTALESQNDSVEYMKAIIPLIKAFWPEKDPRLRDEMLKTLIILQPYLANTRHIQQDQDLVESLSGLLNILVEDYCLDGRPRRHLTLADLRLGAQVVTDKRLIPMRNRTTSLSRATEDAEHNWTSLHFIALFLYIVDGFGLPPSDDRPEIDDDDAPRKRLKLSSVFEDFLQTASTSAQSTKEYTAQIVAATVNTVSVGPKNVQKALSTFASLLQQSSGDLASWALFGLAGCASQDCARDPSTQHVWLGVWHSAFRLITSTAHSRYACHTLVIMLQSGCVVPTDILETLHSLLDEEGLNTPACFSDAGVSLWLEVTRVVGTHGNGKTVSRCADRLSTWLKHKWSPSDFHDWHYALHVSQSSTINAVFLVIQQLYGTSFNALQQRFACSLDIGQTWLERISSNELTDYLLLLRDDKGPLERPTAPAVCKEHSASNAADAVGPRTRLVEHLSMELEKVIAGWHVMGERQTKATGAESVQMLVCLISAADWVDALSEDLKTGHLQTMRKRKDTVLKLFADHLMKNQTSVVAVRAALECVGSILPAVTSANHPFDRLRTPFLSDSLISSLVEAYEIRLDPSPEEQEDDDFDDEQMEPEADSQALAKSESGETDSRRDIVILAGPDSYHTCVAGSLMLATCRSKGSSNEATDTVPASFAKYLLSIPLKQFLELRPLFQMLEEAQVNFTSGDAESLLERLARDLLPHYEHERCEVSIQGCIQFMRMTVSLWTDSANIELLHIASQVYDWLVDVVFGLGLSSPTVQIGLSKLLFRILEYNPDFNSQGTSPSVRTSLLRILRQGQLLVQYNIAEGIPQLFSRFVLSQHELIFQDIQKSLPYDAEWREGLAIRLLVLAELAIAWKTLLRRCVYHIFETAGLLESTEKHAAFCLNKIAVALTLEDSKELYVIFSSQLIHTWLDSHSVLAIPFRIFGYDNLLELIAASRSELISQCIIKDQNDSLHAIAESSKRSVEDVVLESFSQAAAYSLASVASRGSQQADGQQSAEHRLREIVGKTAYTRLLKERLPYVVGYLFKRLENEDLFEKAFARRKGYEKAATIFQKMRTIDGPDDFVLSGQQPSFPSKYLLDELERLCRRTNTDPHEIWDQSLTSIVTRMVLDDICPPLGSLQSRKVIRRIRILVSLSGSSSLHGYPLEMLLHALRPFLTDKYCSRDTISLYQYLLEAGRAHLEVSITFLAGTCLAIFLEMRSILLSTQDSTTQESEHQMTLEKAQSFRQWLGDWIKSLGSADVVKGFHPMMNRASLIKGNGSADSQTAEGKLLLSILSDRRNSKSVLSKEAANVALSLLCDERFQAPASFHKDLLGADDQAARYATQVWQSCRDAKVSQPYMQWAARALGRSFNHMGAVPPAMNVESDLVVLLQRSSVHNALLTSKGAILRIFVDLLHCEQQESVSLAEHTLRRLLCKTRDTDEGLLIQDHMPAVIVKALLCDAAMDPLKDDCDLPGTELSISESFDGIGSKPVRQWLHEIILALAGSANGDLFMKEVQYSLKRGKHLSEQLFPYVLHCVLHSNRVLEKQLDVVVSQEFRKALKTTTSAARPYVRHLLNALLFLRTQRILRETTNLDRNTWLDVDCEEAAVAATECLMHKAALLLVEVGQTLQPRSIESASRRSSVKAVQRPVPHHLLLSVFRNLDEPDSFHGVPQHASLETVADRLTFEASGVGELLLRGAQHDGAIRSGQAFANENFGGVINSLARLNMSSLTSYLMSSPTFDSNSPAVADSAAKAAIKLRQWDLPALHTDAGTTSSLYSALQSVHLSRCSDDLSRALHTGIANIFSTMSQSECVGQQLRSSYAALAALTDVDEVLSSRSETDLDLVQKRLEHRQQWMLNNRLEDAAQILTTRETIFGMTCDNRNLRDMLGIELPLARLMDVRTNLQSSSIFRAHGSIQEALNNVTYLSQIAKPCEDLGLDVSAAVRLETAQVLWDRGELLPSIRILQEIETSKNLDKQALPISRAALLATLGHHVSEARSEKPEQVMDNYLARAWRELKRADLSKGTDVGNVYHEYARYCHAQLTSPENVGEMQRSERFTSKRRAEVQELDRLLTTKLSDTEKHRVKSDRNKSKKWYEIDRTENERLSRSRNEFLRQALDAYLRSLAASDDHDTDLLRFLALWLEHASNPISSESVSRNIGGVPSLKFAPLMNQLASRLQDTDDTFQKTMIGLVGRVCVGHPYHGMYHIYAGCKTQGGNDRTAISRNAATKRVAHLLLDNPKTSDIWKRICLANDLYLTLASARSDAFKPGSKFALKKFSSSKAVEREIYQLKVPPITLDIPLRADSDYSTVPVVAGYKADMAIAGGLSAPKILTALASNGQSCKQLFKAGADDLRQDAIMEQVFEQVSSLLGNQRETRQRKLRVRTYKVVPLDATSGAIEFVQSTMPLNDYLRSAHQKYHPRDLKWDACRNKVEEVRSRSLETRVKTYRSIADNFNPVLRHFFFEGFKDPDEWFERRLAYTRSTAAISILGHALGLGDRHCQNILLDTSTGEVVHIDLGVAFEAGRILAVPEVVPFRLTRDIVDGFGVMGTEGVFRRCCEFTLEALRQNRDAVMTLLNVLRYDPLYSWSMSPLRAKRLQEEQDREVSDAATGAAQATAAGKSRSRLSDLGMKGGGAAAEPVAAPKVNDNVHDDEGGEADRALSVVERKLAPGLSVMATVNELIQAATDEKNLAVLFCGWAAYA